MQKLNENHVIHGWRQMNANGSMCLDCEAHRGTWKINHLLFPSIHGLVVNESPGKVNLTPWLLGRHNKVDKFAALWKKIKLVTDSWFVTVIVDDSWNFVCRILKGSLNLTEVVAAVFSAPRWAEENVGYLTVSGCGVLRKSTANQELLQPRFVLACFQQFFHPNLGKIDTNSASTAFHRLLFIEGTMPCIPPMNASTNASTLKFLDLHCNQF